MVNFAVNRSTVRRRLIFIFTATVLAILLLIGRLAWIQIVRADELYDQAWEQWNHNLPVQTSRGSIYDRNGGLLAGSASADTIAVIPQQVEDPRAAAEALGPVLNIEKHKLEELLSMEINSVYIKRKVSAPVAETVRDMGIPGIIFFAEEKRNYPGERLAAQLLGFVGADRGLAGLEAYYEDYLKGAESRLFYPADGRGKQLPHYFNRFAALPDNYDLYLGVDETIQHIVERELALIMEEAAPARAMALAVDPRTGAVLAAAAKPDYDPDNFDRFDPESWSLPPFNASFEPGSTFKMVILAAAIEEGLFDPNERYDCSGYVTVNNRRINCWTAARGGHGNINYFEAVGGSCNPAFIELGGRLGKEKLFHYIKGFGFGRPTGIDYPGENSGMVFELDQVNQLELATSTFGQGISVTPVQQVMAVTAMINGGYLLKPYLVEEMRTRDGETFYRREPEVVRQVISKETSEQLIALMESVILEGTGFAAAVENYRVAGKTGTAEKIDEEGNYRSDEFIYSLAGFAPVEDPRIVLYVAVDGVTTGPQFGSYTSAPLFKRIMEDTLNYMQVPTSGGSTAVDELD